MRTMVRLASPSRVYRAGDAEIRIGGRGTSFVPEIELRRWESQSVRMRLLHNEPGIVTIDQQAVVWTTPSLEARWYPLPEQRYEFAVLFHGALPPAVRFAFDTSSAIQTTYQPPLAQRGEDGSTWERNPWGGRRYRPADVMDSFASYVPWSGDYTALGGWNYQSGKVCHLYRPWIVDAVGQYAWCDVALERGVLTVTIPQAFRASALGPCLLDPTFGYSGTAASDDNIGGARILCLATSTPASSGTLDSVTIKGRIRNDGQVPHPNHAPAIYSDSAGAPNNKLAASDVTGTSYGVSDAEVLTNLSYGSLTSAVQYWLGTRQAGAITDYGPAGAGDDAWFKYDASGGTNLYFRSLNNDSAWEATGASYSSASNEKVYIYGTFTSAGAAFIAQPPRLIGQAVKRSAFF